MKKLEVQIIWVKKGSRADFHYNLNYHDISPIQLYEISVIY